MTLPTTPGTFGRVRNTKAAFTRRLAATCVLAATVLGLSVSAASAGTDESITTKYGTASFNDKDEVVIADDKRKDGLGVQAFVFWKVKKKTVSVTVTDGNGANNSPNTMNLKIREGTKVKMKQCIVDNRVVLDCSRVQVATA